VAHQQLMVPQHWLSTCGRRTFIVTGPMTFGVLPDQQPVWPFSQHFSLHDDSKRHTSSRATDTFTAV